MGFNSRQKLQFFHCIWSKGLSLYFMCSDQHVKYWMPCGFPLTSSLLLDYHAKQHIHTYTHTFGDSVKRLVSLYLLALNQMSLYSDVYHPMLQPMLDLVQIFVYSASQLLTIHKTNSEFLHRTAYRKPPKFSPSKVSCLLVFLNHIFMFQKCCLVHVAAVM